MEEITLSITKLKEYAELFKGLQSGATPALAVGLPPAAKAQLAAALRLETGRPVLVVTDEDNAALRIAGDLSAFSGLPVVHIPARELTMAGMEGMSRQYEQARIAALAALSDAPLAVVSAAALVQKTLPPETLRAASFTLFPGDLIPLDRLTARLVTAGFVMTGGTGTDSGASFSPYVLTGAAISAAGAAAGTATAAGHSEVMRVTG